MTAIITPCAIAGSMTAPPSKSCMQRACAAALLHQGTTYIYNRGSSNDELATLHVIAQSGAEVSKTENNVLIIKSNGIAPVANEINFGESGLGIRMLTPILALSDQPVVLTGTGSLLSRTMHVFDHAFAQLGVDFTSANGRLPFFIKGPLKPANITVDGSVSSQFITGLLMAYSVAVPGRVCITVNNLGSRPYIDLTLQVIQSFGLSMPVNEDYKRFIFHTPAHINNADVHYTVEGDWSSAAFMLVAAAIAGQKTVKGLNMQSLQADKAIIQALEQAGCTPYISENEVTIRHAPLHAFYFNCTDSPDLFLPLVSLAAYCKGTTVIKGVHRLQHKESNRSVALQQEFKKMGVAIDINGDLMYIHGGGYVQGAVTDSHNDHRIAMACAVAGLPATGETAILNPEVVNKSYPGFFNDLKS